MKRIPSLLLLIVCFILLGCREDGVPAEHATVDATEGPTVKELPQVEESIVAEDVIAVPVTELTVSSPDEMPELDALSKMIQLSNWTLM